MKTSEIFSPSPSSPFGYGKKLNAEFRKTAADFDVTISAGMGWPAFNSDGVWYGGGFLSKGGATKADSLTLPLEIRIRGFIKRLASQLEQLLESGQTIRIAPGAVLSAKKDLITPTKGTIQQALTDSIRITRAPGKAPSPKHPCVAWFVEYPSSMKGMESFQLVIFGKNTNKASLHVSLYSTLPSTEALKYDKWLKDIHDRALMWNRQFYTQWNKEHPGVDAPDVYPPFWDPILKAVISEMQELGIQPGMLSSQATHMYFTRKTLVGRLSPKLILTEQMRRILDAGMNASAKVAK